MLAFFATLFSLAAVVTPCDSVGTTGPSDRCSFQAHRAPSSTSISIDGQLTEEAWKSAPTISGFRQLVPQEGAPPSQRTVVRTLYGDDAFYVVAMLYDDHPERIRARLTRRDQLNQADWFEVSIDSYYDQKTARTFAVNAAGVQRDGVVQGNRLDTSWDALWTSDVRLTNEGWIAEIRIPYSELRFSEADEQKWGIQFRRRIPRNSEVSEWPLVQSSERNNLVAQYGTLTHLQNLDAKRTVRASPYTVGRVQTQEDPQNRGTRATSANYDAGANFELGLSSNSTLTATINPDFGQVEADPAVLNLSAFETFFPEKRPFFVQGTDIFEFDLGRRTGLLYTRRIGGQAPVIGAMKMTGRSQTELSYGVMAATTGHDFSPTRNYGVGRVSQDFGLYSTAGAILTAFDGPAGNGRNRAFSGGVDWDLRFRENAYQFRGFLSGTHERSTLDRVDPTTGLAASTEFGKVQGDWTYDLGFEIRDDDFDPNAMGRMRENNYFRVRGVIDAQFNGGQPFGPFQNGEGFLFLGQSWSYQDRLSRGFGFFSRFEFLTDGFRSINLGLNGDKLFGGYDLFETRGLWPRARPRTLSTELSVQTDSRRDWTVELSASANPRSDGGIEWSTGLETEWSIGSRLKLSGELSYETESDAVEWAANDAFLEQSNGTWALASDPDAETFRPLEAGHDRLDAILADIAPVNGSNLYHVPVYGARDTERLNLTLRSNLALTRNLSFEFFGQLFAARGQYRDFRILSSPNHFDSFSAYPKRHDFATSSFLTNAVLRWEFRPGSELFVVWSQDRRLSRDDPYYYDASSRSPYRRSTTARLTDAFDDFARNAFIIKLRYTFY